MYRMLVFTTMCAAAFIVRQAQSAESDGPSPEVPELKVLEHFVGNWDVRVISSDSSEPVATGTVEAHWTLGGRFVIQTGTISTKESTTVLQVTTLMTYDVDKKVYRRWMFTSTGESLQQEGYWDEATRTMTSTGDTPDGDMLTVIARFPEEGAESWTIRTTDKQGTVRGEIHGKNTRRAK